MLSINNKSSFHYNTMRASQSSVIIHSQQKNILQSIDYNKSANTLPLPSKFTVTNLFNLDKPPYRSSLPIPIPVKNTPMQDTFVGSPENDPDLLYRTPLYLRRHSIYEQDSHNTNLSANKSGDNGTETLHKLPGL